MISLCFGDDKVDNKEDIADLLKYLKNGDINYIVIYNDFTVDKKICKVNNYYKYLLIDFLEDLITGN